MRRLLRTARSLAAAYGRHWGSQHAAAISYRVLFSLVPFVALVVSLVDLVLPESPRQHFVDWLFSAVPGEDVEATVDRTLAHSGANAPIVGLVSLAVLLWSASGMVSSVRRAFWAIWESEARPAFVSGKLRDFALVGFAGALVVAAFALSVAVQVVVQTGTDAADAMGLETSGRALGRLAEAGTSWAAVAAALIVLYRVLPPPPVRLADVWSSALVAALAFQLAVAGFAVYAARFADFSSVYGPLGAVLAFLLLVYLLAIVVLVGAEAVARRVAREG